MDRQQHFNLWYAIAALVVVIAIQDFFSDRGHMETIPYSQFEAALRAGEITDVTVGDKIVRGTYKASGADGSPRHFTAVRVEPDLAKTLVDAKVKFAGDPGPGVAQRFMSWLLPTIGFVLLWVFLSQRMMGSHGAGMMAIGKSKAKVYMEKSIDTTFADVAGVDEAKAELQEVIAFLKDPKSYGRLGAHVPKGVLLVGPPGTGKTLLARAVAGEAGVPFFSISGSEFVEMFVGVGAARVRDLFEQARKHAPCIIFIDELDALGRARGVGLPGSGHDEKEQTLNQLLTEMDGFDASSGVVLLSATNRPEILDPALLRAGRFDRQILVDRPDKTGRAAILRVHLKKVRVAAQVEIDQLAALTTGFTGADLANLVNEAALLATRRRADEVTTDDLLIALERLIAGLEKKNRLLNAHERQIVAYHEVGHALAAMALPGTDPVQKVSIIPRGIGALGYTIQRPTEDRYLMGRQELARRMTVLLGGRAAEKLVFGDVSTGAADDLAKASEIARNMVVRYGMTERLGEVSYESDPAPLLGGPAGESWRPRRYAEATAAAIDEAVRELIDAAAKEAATLLGARRAGMDAAVLVLLSKETLTGAELAALVAAPESSSPAVDVAG